MVNMMAVPGSDIMDDYQIHDRQQNGIAWTQPNANILFSDESGSFCFNPLCEEVVSWSLWEDMMNGKLMNRSKYESYSKSVQP